MAERMHEDGSKFPTQEEEPQVDETTYLGDGAYVKHYVASSEVVVFTSDGRETQNRVVLGPREIAALVSFFDRRGFL